MTEAHVPTGGAVTMTTDPTWRPGERWTTDPTWRPGEER